MLLFQDGSTHRWIGALDHDLDLVVTLDDATGAIYSAILVEEEGTMSSFLGLRETIAAHGLFRAFYTDRGSHYFHTPKAGGKVDKSKPTQVGRALAQLGITHIPSYSPEARGRMERVFGTLQSRLPPELRLAEIDTLEAANRYLQRAFVPDYNARFAVPAAEAGSAFIPYAGRPLDDILCIQESARSGATTASTGTGSRCRSRRSAIAIITSRPPCGCTNIPTAGLPSSMARAASRGSTRTESRSMSRAPLNSARRRRPDGLVDNAARSPQPHRPSNNSSGHLMRYDTRTSSRATDTIEAA